MDNVNVTNISFITGFFICFEYLICKERLPHKGGVRRTSVGRHCDWAYLARTAAA